MTERVPCDPEALRRERAAWEREGEEPWAQRRKELRREAGDPSEREPHSPDA